MLTLLAKLLSALNGDSSIRQIALAIALGFLVGLSPLFTLHNIVIIFFVLMIRVHLGSFILSLGFFSGVSYLLSPMIVQVGESILTQPRLEVFFTSLYQLSIFKLAHWHHTYVLGAFVLGTLLCVPIYFISKIMIDKYRVHIMTFLEKFRIVKALKASKFYSVYSTFSGESSLSRGGL